MASYFLSDIHLKSLDDESSRLLLLFLRNIWPKAPGDIYLLGDIFDIWVSNHSLFIKKYAPLIDELKKVKLQGFKVVYFEGNHDLHLKKFWKQELGFEVYYDVGFFSIEGQIFRLEHGDLINQKDLDYLKLRRFLRTPTMIALGHWLPGRFWNMVGEKWSSTSRKATLAYQQQRNAEVVNMIREHAKSEVLKRPFDCIVSGHMHVVDDFDFEANGKKIRSFNLGTWLDGAKILKYENQNFTWLKSDDIDQIKS